MNHQPDATCHTLAPNSRCQPSAAGLACTCFALPSPMLVRQPTACLPHWYHCNQIRLHRRRTGGHWRAVAAAENKSRYFEILLEDGPRTQQNPTPRGRQPLFNPWGEGALRGKWGGGLVYALVCSRLELPYRAGDGPPRGGSGRVTENYPF
jgi:hypothetical protein